MKRSIFLKQNLQKGQVARLLIVLAAVVLVAALITFIVIRMADRPAKPVTEEEEQVKLPVYEQQLGNIRFVFQSANDRGDTLKKEDLVNQDYFSQKDLKTTERFIMVTIGAQNKGTLNTEQGAWDMANIVDDSGRNFIALESYIVNGWLPANNGCGKLLKPAFDPTPCTKIYEVSKESKGLKIQVVTGLNNNSPNDLSADRKLSYDLDLIVK